MNNWLFSPLWAFSSTSLSPSKFAVNCDWLVVYTWYNFPWNNYPIERASCLLLCLLSICSHITSICALIVAWSPSSLLKRVLLCYDNIWMLIPYLQQVRQQLTEMRVLLFWVDQLHHKDSQLPGLVICPTLEVEQSLPCLLSSKPSFLPTDFRLARYLIEHLTYKDLVSCLSRGL